MRAREQPIAEVAEVWRRRRIPEGWCWQQRRRASLPSLPALAGRIVARQRSARGGIAEVGVPKSDVVGSLRAYDAVFHRPSRLPNGPSPDMHLAKEHHVQGFTGDTHPAPAADRHHA